MARYKYYIYYRDGRVSESGGYSGVGAESSCESAAVRQFEQQVDMYKNQPEFAPTRYVVKEVKD